MPSRRGRRVLPSLTVVLLLVASVAAGCLGTGEPTDDAADEAGHATAPTGSAGDASEAGRAPAQPVRHALPIDWAGSLGTYAYACESAVVDTCEGGDVVPYAASLFIDEVDGNLTGLAVVMMWNATSPATEELALEAMIMVPGCPDCEQPTFAYAAGRSPLGIDMMSLALAADHPEAVLHLYVWAPMGGQRAGSVSAFAQVDDAFHVIGEAYYETAPLP